MTCSQRESDLLFFSLGEVNLLQRARLSYHLLFCEACRSQQREMAQTSAKLAVGLKLPEGGSRLLPTIFNLKLAQTIFLCIVIGFSATVITAAWQYRAYILSVQKKADDGCRPDLPNDQCR